MLQMFSVVDSKFMRPYQFVPLLSILLLTAVRAQNFTSYVNATSTALPATTATSALYYGGIDNVGFRWRNEPANISSYCLSSISSDFSSWSSLSANGVQTPLLVIAKGTTRTVWRPPEYALTKHIKRPCCGQCSLDIPLINIVYFKPTALPPSVSSVVSDGFTFVSPSVYLAYHRVRGVDACGFRTGASGDEVVEIEKTTIGYPPKSVSSLLLNSDDDFELTLPFDANIPIPETCQTTGWVGHTTTIDGKFYHAPYCWPAILNFPNLESIDPAFAGCTAFGYAYDPPIALTQERSSLTPTSAAPAPTPLPPLITQTARTPLVLPTAIPLEPPYPQDPPDGQEPPKTQEASTSQLSQDPENPSNTQYPSTDQASSNIHKSQEFLPKLPVLSDGSNEVDRPHSNSDQPIKPTIADPASPSKMLVDPIEEPAVFDDPPRFLEPITRFKPLLSETQSAATSDGSRYYNAIGIPHYYSAPLVIPDGPVFELGGRTYTLVRPGPSAYPTAVVIDSVTLTATAGPMITLADGITVSVGHDGMVIGDATIAFSSQSSDIAENLPRATSTPNEPKESPSGGGIGSLESPSSSESYQRPGLRIAAWACITTLARLVFDYW